VLKAIKFISFKPNKITSNNTYLATSWFL